MSAFCANAVNVDCYECYTKGALQPFRSLLFKVYFRLFLAQDTRFATAAVYFCLPSFKCRTSVLIPRSPNKPRVHPNDLTVSGEDATQVFQLAE